jgi:hypothetical protein
MKKIPSDSLTPQTIVQKQTSKIFDEQHEFISRLSSSLFSKTRNKIGRAILEIISEKMASRVNDQVSTMHRP